MLLQHTLVALFGLRHVFCALVIERSSELLAFGGACFCRRRRYFALWHRELLLTGEKIPI